MPTTPNYSQPAIFSEVATPTVPDSGYLKVYANSGTLCSIANGGSEKSYVAISGSGLPIGAYTLPTTDGTSSQVLQTNGSGTVTWQTVSGGGGGGITSINGNSTAAQLLTVGTSGTDFAIDSVTTAGTSVFNIPDASATARGLITTGTQTIAGAKTFSSAVAISSAANLTFNSTGGIVLGGGGLIYDDGGLAPYFRNNGIRLQGSGADYTNTGIFWGVTLSTAMSLRSDNSATVLALRGGTTAQTFRVYNTYTSGTSLELLQARGVASANFELGPMKGSAGGTLRGLTIGGYATESAAITPWLSFDNAGNVGIGTVTPSWPLHIVESGGVDAVIGARTFYTDAASHYSSFLLERARGTSASPLIIANGDTVGSFQANAYQGVAYNAIASIEFAIDGAVTSGQRPPGRIVFSTGVANGAVTERMRVSTTGNITVTQGVSATGSPTAFTLTGAAHTTLALSTEATDVNFNLARTVQFATGAITTQRAFRIQAPTYGFVGASTITNATTLELSPPVAGTNATITNTSALVVNFADTGNTRAVRIVGPGTAGTVWTAFDIANGATNYFKVNVYGIYAQTFEEAAGTGVFTVLAGKTFNLFSGNTHITGDSNGLYIQPQVAHNTQLRSGTNAQSFGVYGTWTSTTSYERVNVRGKASANFEIGPENGSAGGTLRGLTIGGYSAGSSTITPWLSFTSSGTPTFDQGTVVIPSGGTGLLCQQTNIYLDSYGTHSGIRYRRSEGTQGTPLAVANNSLLGFFATYGYHGAGYHSTQGCAISFYATEAFTSGAQGSKIVFGTTPNGTTTNTVALTIDQNQVATFSKLVAQSAAEITNTPSGTTQTITLNDGNHQTLTLTSSTGAVTATLTVPSNVSSGTIIVKQHASVVRNITWAVSAGTIKWMGTQPTWSSDAANDIRIVSWRYDGSVMYLMSTDKAA